MFTLHVGFSGFPQGMASAQRILLTFKGLKEAGSKPLVINKISHNQYSTHKKVRLFEGIPYVNTSCSNSKSGSFIIRNLNRLSGYFGELVLFVKKRKKFKTAILYSNYFLEYPYYFILSRLFGFKLIIQYVEMFSAVPGRNSFFTRINDWLIDRYICTFCDGVIAISDYLERHIKKLDPVIPVIKIPANSDYAKIAAMPVLQDGPYLMYCGTIYYEEVIEFIISIFVQLKINKKYEGRLLLVISGDHEKNWGQLRSFLDTVSFNDSIVIKSNIPHEELLSAYKGADLLMIPLRDTIQDIARFPHKVGEYTAARRPIISTNLGELKIYFEDGISAVLPDIYSIEAYYEKLSNLLSSRDVLDRIGIEGYSIGINNFDYKKQGQKLKKFIDDL